MNELRRTQTMELTLKGAPAKKRRLNAPENADIQIPSTSTQDQAEKKEGLTKTQHGVAYQIKLLMLFFQRGAKYGYSFKLKTELTNSGKLDDVVFEYDQQNDKVEDGVRYLQAKHSKDKTKTIQFDDLLKENDKLFGLSKYYISFLEIVRSLKSKGKSTELVKQITLCTNIKFHENLEKCMLNMKVTQEEDNILYGNIVLNRYKFKTKVDIRKKSKMVGRKANDIIEGDVEEALDQVEYSEVKTEFPGKDDIVSNLSTVTDMHALANKFARDLSKEVIPFNSIYQTYYGWLVKHIFELPEEFLEKERKELMETENTENKTKKGDNHKWYVKFRKTFIEIEHGELKIFRENLLKEMAVINVQTILNSWRVTKINTVEKFCSEAENNDTPKDFNKLAKALAYSLSENKKLTLNKLYLSSHGWLLNNVFYIPRRHIKIKNDFLSNKSNYKDVIAFRQFIDVYLKKNKKGPKTLTALRGKAIFVTKDFFNKPESDRTPDNTISRETIETFLNKLVFVVTCDEETLGRTVQQELGNELNLIEDELIASDLEVRMLKFMKDETEYFVTHNTWKEFINKHINIIARYASMGTTEKRKMKIDKFKCKFEKQEKKRRETLRVLDKIMTVDKRLMIIYQKYPLLTEIKIHQAFGKLRDEYIVENLEDSVNELDLKIAVEDNKSNRGTILKSFSSNKRSHLVIINDEVKICDKRMQFLKDVIKILNNNKEKRLTLITVEKNEKIRKILQSSFKENYEELIDNDTFLDLTISTQNLLEKRKVIFQGRETYLGKLVVGDKLKSYIKGEVLLKLITDKEKIIIGDAPVHQSNLDTFEEIEKCYISRSLFRLITIKDNIRRNNKQFCLTTDKKIESKHIDKKDIVLITQNVDAKAFIELCGMYDTNIHWLVNVINIGLVWQKTRGDITKLHKHVERHCKIYDSKIDESIKNYYTYKINDVTGLSKNVVLIAADPGMGKSTFLTQLTSTINDPDQVTWIVRINLKDLHFSMLNDNEDSIDESNAMKFLYKVLKFEIEDNTGKKNNIFDFATFEDDLLCLDNVESLEINEFKILEIEIFNKFFNDNNVVLLLDGCDEIDQNLFISWLEQIQFYETKMKKVWMTTRPYNIQSILENKFGVFSYQLNPITERSKEFVRKFWKTRLTHAPSESLETNVKTEKKLDVYIEELFKTSFSTQSESTFIGVPLHIRMIAEIYEKGFEEFYYSEDKCLTDQQRNKITRYTLVSLYEAFVNTKFDILHRDIDKKLVKNARMLKSELEAVRSYHKKLALTEILHDNEIKNLLSNEDINEVETTFEENDIGLVRSVENKICFVHRTFAEYFTAGYLVDRLKCGETLQVYETIQNSGIKLVISLQNLDSHKVLSCIKDYIKLDVMKFVNYNLIENIDSDNRVVLNGVLSGNMKVLENKDLQGVCDMYNRTPLHLACTGHNLDNFKHIFDIFPAALDSLDNLFDWTPVHYAIASHTTCDSLDESDFNFLKHAMKMRKYDVNQKDKFDETLLMLSIKNACELLCFYELLVSFDEIDLHYENKYNMTALDYCYESPYWNYLQYYFFKTAELCTDKVGKRLLNIILEDDEGFDRNMRQIMSFRGKEYTKQWIKVCIESDNTLIVRLLSENLIVANLVLDIESEHIDVNFIDYEENDTALKRAVLNDIEFSRFFGNRNFTRHKVYILLLKAGAFYDDIEEIYWENLWTKPDYLSNTMKDLFDSIKNNDTSITESILLNLDSKYIDKDVLVNIRTRKHCMTPLQFAAYLGYKDIVICLLQHGAFYNVSDLKRNLKTAEELTQNRDIFNLLAKTRILFGAVEEGNIGNVMNYLDVNVNFKDRKGKQPLHLAVENENLEIVKHLLKEKGIVLTDRTLAENNVLHMAVNSGNNEILQTLLDHLDPEELKEIINTYDIYLNTPLDIAIDQQNDTAIAALELKNGKRFLNIPDVGHDSDDSDD